MENASIIIFSEVVKYLHYLKQETGTELILNTGLTNRTSYGQPVQKRFILKFLDTLSNQSQTASKLNTRGKWVIFRTCCARYYFAILFELTYSDRRLRFFKSKCVI